MSNDDVLITPMEFIKMLNCGKLTKPADLIIVRNSASCGKLSCVSEEMLPLLQANSCCEVVVRVVTLVLSVGVQNF